MTDLPESLKKKTNEFLDELEKEDIKIRLDLLTSLITSEITMNKDRVVQNTLTSYVVSGILDILERLENPKEESDNTIEDMRKHGRKHGSPGRNIQIGGYDPHHS